MGLIVIDASVAVKWIIAESGSGAALTVLHGGASLLSPDLVSTEVAGAIARHHREQRLSMDTTRHAYAIWSTLLDQEALLLRPTVGLIDRAFEMAIEAEHPVADCVYLACAEALGATVLTADQAMYERGRRVFRAIEMLSMAA